MKFNKKFLIVLIGCIIVYSLFLILSDFSKLSEEILNFEIMYLPLILILVPLGWLALYFRWTLLLKNSGYVLPHKKNFQIFYQIFAESIILINLFIYQRLELKMLKIACMQEAN